MALFSSDSGYDRSRLIQAAERARGRHQRRKAIRLYRQILAVEPGNWDVHARVAPLLAQTGRSFDAWVSFRSAGRGFARDGNIERALQQYRVAARHLPRRLEVWLAIADIERKRGRKREAIQALIEGRRRCRARSLRPEAIHLLRHARQIEAWNPDVVIDLARLLSKTDQKDEARMLLTGMAERSRGRTLRRVRATQWRNSPTPGHAWRWLCAAVGGSGPQRRAMPLRTEPLFSGPTVNRVAVPSRSLQRRS
jgi:tetratricopeptide (TPR) repeat protein